MPVAQSGEELNILMAQFGKKSVMIILVIRMLKFFADLLDCHFKMQNGQMRDMFMPNTHIFHIKQIDTLTITQSALEMNNL